MTTATVQTAEESKLAALIVEALNLEVTPQEVDAGAPLYRDGLGLDSIDILEIALVVSKTYGVQLKADDADKARLLEEYPTNTRGYYWVTRDSKNASGKKDPLENLLARPVDHDASEAIASFVKTYNGKGGTAQAYFLANAKGDRQEKAPADIVEDHTRVRGVEIKNTISCVACHLEGLRLPTVPRCIYASTAQRGTQRIGQALSMR